jgi:predicted nucleic acid-binding protein
MKIVSNSSPLIALAKIEKLGILEYDIVIPKAVFNETTEPEKEYMKELYEWGKDKVVGVKNRKAVEYLELIVGKGEAETIVISEELNADAVLIDDLKARKIARLRGLKVIGTIGVLLDAKERGRVHEVKPLLEELMKNKIRISEELHDHALELATEY